MKSNIFRIIMFTVITALSSLLLGAAGHSSVVPRCDTGRLQAIALDIKDIPHSNRADWELSAKINPRLLIILSTSRVTRINLNK
jgi:hypothetical protein